MADHSAAPELIALTRTRSLWGLSMTDPKGDDWLVIRNDRETPTAA
jgi:hypothetical protein